MAKIVVTAYRGPGQEPAKRIIDTDICKFEEIALGGTFVILEKGGFAVDESIEEICKRINEAEAQATNQKVDEINENLKAILRKLDLIYIAM
jgi:hypothetical protein